jgi:hypothetical protein
MGLVIGSTGRIIGLRWRIIGLKGRIIGWRGRIMGESHRIERANHRIEGENRTYWLLFVQRNRLPCGVVCDHEKFTRRSVRERDGSGLVQLMWGAATTRISSGYSSRSPSCWLENVRVCIFSEWVYVCWLSCVVVSSFYSQINPLRLLGNRTPIEYRTCVQHMIGSTIRMRTVFSL